MIWKEIRVVTGHLKDGNFAYVRIKKGFWRHKIELAIKGRETVSKMTRSWPEALLFLEYAVHDIKNAITIVKRTW